jgi:hypothetical protein
MGSEPSVTAGVQSSMTRRPVRIRVTGDLETELAFSYGARVR